MSKIGRRARGQRSQKLNTKPFGFCCSQDHEDPEAQYRYYNPKTSLPSIRSIHECAALRIREQLILKRGRRRNGVGIETPRASIVNFDTQQLGKQGKRGKFDPSDSEIDLMIDEYRVRRQKEYEEQMDRWVAIAEKRIEEDKKKFITCGRPHWYVDFSLPQLKCLKELEESLCKDKEDETTCRTLQSMVNIGMITKEVKVQSKNVIKFINKFSSEPVKFLHEVYKAISGKDCLDEEYRINYQCTERLILSAMAFLELPHILEELHKRLPPVCSYEFSTKPKRPTLTLPKKKVSPLLENLAFPSNWRLYENKFQEWREKRSDIPKPLVILTKKKRNNCDDKKIEKIEIEKKIRKKSSCTGSADNTDKTINIKKGKDDVSKDNGVINNQNKKISVKIKVDKEEYKSNEELFPEQTNWTSPPTKCPYKYQKLMKEKGPLITDEEFFAELKLAEQKEFPRGRGNLSFNMQHLLFDTEAEFHNIMEQSDRLTSEVGHIAKEIFDPPHKCGACCSCKQTRRAHLKWHSTKEPHAVIDAINVNETSKAQVVGSMAMHTPAASLSTLGEPPCIPSTEKIAKNLVIAGTTSLVDGETVRQVAGVTKALELVPHELLRPEFEIVEIKNVPPCGCGGTKVDEQQDAEEEAAILDNDKDKNICYGKKFRPKEGPAYTCKKFSKEKEFEYPEESNYGEEEWEDFDQLSEYCIYGECEDESYSSFTESKDCRICCDPCGKKVDVECTFQYPQKGKKKDGNIRRRCSCNSLSEFLQMDLTWMKCFEPKVEVYIRKPSEIEYENEFSNEVFEDEKESENDSRIFKRSRKRRNNSKTKIKEKKSTASEDEKSSRRNCALESPSITEERPCIDETKDGPYGYRTKSEEALPVVRTIAYLTDGHPLDAAMDQVPVREGGRPCRCRENRNNRKTLIYGIAGLVDSFNRKKKGKKKQRKQLLDDSARLIEGVTWLTPVASIRGSDEYIPEYDLYNSPYEKGICGATKKEQLEIKTVLKKKGEEGSEEGIGGGSKKRNDEDSIDEIDDRSKDLRNAGTDPYLTEFFTNKKEKVPCWVKCAKFKKKSDEPRILRALKPVCECKYERRIVKRKEERIQWLERQRRLKSLKKESFLHVTQISQPVHTDAVQIVSAAKLICNSSTNEMEPKSSVSNLAEHQRKEQPLIIIGSVTQQTPYATPENSHERIFSGKPIIPKPMDENFDATDQTAPTAKPDIENGLLSKSDNRKQKSSKNSKGKCSDLRRSSRNNSSQKTKSSLDGKVEQKGRKEVEKATDKQFVNCTKEFENMKKGKRESYFDQLEKDLLDTSLNELKRMSEENSNFISIRFPDYDKMPQLSYWISYRIRGLNFTENYKKQLLNKSIEIWKVREKKLHRSISSGSLKISKKEKKLLNFDKAMYWKKKISKKKMLFYKEVHEDILNYGRCMWRTMEFGKFPSLLFKQAFFTYLPAKEMEVYAHCPFPL